MPERALSARFPTDLPAWRKLKRHYREDISRKSIAELFQDEPQRVDAMTIESADLLLDFSKNLVTAKTLSLLHELTAEARLPEWRDAMFAGRTLNDTEHRAALHVALRSEPEDGIAPDVPGVNDVADCLSQMGDFVAGIQEGRICGQTGRRFAEVVNIGIGGSDLGIVMASRALRHCWAPGINFHSVSNVDGTQLSDLTEYLDPEETLFVICSKTFTTLETMTNAQAASQWITERLGAEAVGFHFAAASTNHAAMDAFGINADYRFGFWDWVGGRYSLWSAVGLALALVIGMRNFRALLAGGRLMDRHFLTANLDRNMPVCLALISLWYNNFFGAETHAILPYDNRLDRFPAFLQQLQMESNGKRVRRDGRVVKAGTGQVIWGEPGSNAQHSFYQLLHQGTRFVPIDFLLPIFSSGALQEHQDLAVANCLAQAEALMDGYPTARAKADLLAAGMSAADARLLAAHKTHPGSHPSNVLLFDSLTPSVLGQLIALYEHKVFVESVIWGINPFDQWGVELGKRLASGLIPVVRGEANYSGKNRSTEALLERIRRRH